MTYTSGKTCRCIAAYHRGWLLLPLALLLLMLPLSGWSQDDAAEDGEDSSEHVEESEEAYRRRMELEEAGDRADVILDRSAGPLKAPEGMDALPYDSRKHLRDELRNVIIEQGEWQPEDVNANYPYNPSAAAQKDPELRKQEEQAWGDLIQEYHKRESAALEGGGGRSSGSTPGSGGNSGSGQAGATGSESSKSGSQGSGSPDTRPETAATGSTAAGAGVSQSALEFLKGQSGGQSGGQAGGQSGSQSSGQPSTPPGMQAGNATASNTQTQNGAQPQAGSASPAATTAQKGAEQSSDEAEAQMAEAAGSQSESSGKEKEKSGNPPPPPGSLAIAELLALEEGRKQKQVEQGQTGQQKAQEQSAESEKAGKPLPETQQAAKQTKEKTDEKQATSQATVDESAASNTQAVVLKNEADPQPPPPPPGSIAIPELEKLKGMESADSPAVDKPR